jgi:mannobiose 2-epimerase
VSLLLAGEKLSDKFERQAVEQELTRIAKWWREHSIDVEHGGFFGEIDYAAQAVPHASKGIVFHSRILWFFSEIARRENNPEYQSLATRAFQYLIKYFDDPEHGGAYWELAFDGSVIQAKKQTYAQCFCIYALCNYFRLTGDKTALEKALTYFKLVEEHARDWECGGYIEACSETWSDIQDYRLSEKDLNLPKSMNTHLHVLEAYSALYKVHKSAETEEALRHVLEVFEYHIYCRKSAHLKLFFDMQWRNESLTYSFGHDIEASWLLWEATKILGDNVIEAKLKPIVIGLAQVCLDEAIGSEGQVCDEFIFDSQKRIETSYWWVQAEALVGFMNAFTITDTQEFKDVCQPIWSFIQRYHIDAVHGEWHWLASTENSTENRIYKAGFWKAPYHNGRAMMEILDLMND